MQERRKGEGVFNWLDQNFLCKEDDWASQIKISFIVSMNPFAQIETFIVTLEEEEQCNVSPYMEKSLKTAESEGVHVRV